MNIVFILGTASVGFKPYKGVSSNLYPSLYLYLINCFKPYKGVSSNHMKEQIKINKL